MSETILTNARLVLENEVVDGTIVFDGTGIVDLRRGFSRVRHAIDVDGDFVAPGLVEMHTDNPEKHFMPRPNVFWPNKLAAALAHDAQMAAAGVTTVYDSITAGTITGEKDYRRRSSTRSSPRSAMAWTTGVPCRPPRPHPLRADRRWLAAGIRAARRQSDRATISLMDHTPGKRQYRNPKLLQAVLCEFGRNERGRGGARDRRADGAWAAQSREELAGGAGDVQAAWHSGRHPRRHHRGGHLLAKQSGAVISEFPTTEEAAAAAKAAGSAPRRGAQRCPRRLPLRGTSRSPTSRSPARSMASRPTTCRRACCRRC